MNEIEKNLKKMNRFIILWVMIIVSLIAFLLKILL
jgi:hypothetical protein